MKIRTSPNTFLTALLAFALGAIVACNGSGNATSSASTAELRLIGHAGTKPHASQTQTRAMLTGSISTSAVTSVCPITSV